MSDVTCVEDGAATLEAARPPANELSSRPLRSATSRKYVRAALLLFLPALVIRLAVAPISAWPNDVYPWVRLGWDLLAGYSPYDRLGFSYPPGWAAILALPLRALATVLPPDRWAAMVPDAISNVPVVHPLALLAVKLPSILADMAVGWILLRRGRWAAIAWLYNPLIVFVSAVHGQFDSLIALTFLLSYTTARRGQILSSGLTCGLGTILKLVPVYSGPVLACNALRQSITSRGWLGGVRGALAWAGGFALALVPALPLMSGGLFTMAVARANPDLSGAGGLNYTALGKLPWLANPSFWTQQYPVVSRVMLVACPLVLGAIVLWKGEGALFPAFAGGLAATIAFQPVTTPQYFVWLLPVALLGGWRVYGAPALALCAVSLAGFWTYAGNLVTYVSEPLSLYFGLGPPVQEIVRGYNEYAASKGVFGGNITTDRMAIVGSIASLILTWLFVVSVWKAVTCDREQA